jgi:hypothetical protein
MSLFQSVLPKLPGPVRTAFASLIGRIQRSIECTEVYNASPLALARGTIVSYSVDPTKIVIPSSDAVVECKEQYVGVLETSVGGTADPASPTVAIARHCGGPVYTAMAAGLAPHVGDSVWATSDVPGGYGQLIETVGLAPIYVGMIEGLGNYNALAPAGTTGVLVVLKHVAPSIPDPN